jgi:hypothetical protein
MLQYSNCENASKTKFSGSFMRHALYSFCWSHRFNLDPSSDIAFDVESHPDALSISLLKVL